MLVDDGEPDPVDLIEAKTIGEDAHSQIRTAVGQLLDYEYFIVAPTHPGRSITKSVVVNQPVSKELADFLDAQGIGLFHVTDDSVTPLNDVARETGKRRFGLE